MPNQHITGLMSVKNGQKQSMLNISNAREIPYSQYETLTEEQKNGVIICPDYPVGESGTLINANQVSYDNGSTPSLTKGTRAANDPILTSTNTQDAITELASPTFDEASTRENISSGESFKSILGKIKKFFTDLKTVAFSGSYTDLTDKPTIPAAQVNSDWNASSGVAQILNKPTLATVATSGSYNDLSNKPTIPTVNNATLTIQKNGTDVQTFTANQSTNATANITVPTKVSELTNDSGYKTSDNTINVTRSLSVSTATANYWAAMCNSNSTGSPNLPTTDKWWHVLSMDWTGTDTKNWISQLAIATQDGDGVWWRRNNASGTEINSSTWYRLAEGDSNGNAKAAIKTINRNGTTFTATRYDGTTFTFAQQDTNTTYSANNGVGLSGTTFYNSGVRATSINGNYLRVNTNGTNADLTIPYATSAGSASKLGSSTVGSASRPIYLNAGTPTQINYTIEKSVPSNAVFTDTNTWRGIQNNLTSTSTTDSLSANQGRLLATGSARDSTKLPTAGGTMTGSLTMNGTNYVGFGDATIFVCKDSNSWLNVKSVNGNLYRAAYHDFKNAAASAWVTISALSFATQSSRRFKENIESLEPDEAKKILDIRIVKFDYKEGMRDKDRDRYNQCGVIAEEVDEIIPQAVTYRAEDANESSEEIPFGVDYSRFVPYLIKMVQMQQKEIEELKELIKAKGE